MTAPKKRGRGRPLAGPEPLDVQVAIRMTARDRDEMHAAADRVGRTLSNWLRWIGLEAARESNAKTRG